MTSERSVLLTALAKRDPAARAAYLDEACAGDPALRRRVEAMLRSHEEAGRLPESSASPVAPPPVVIPPDAPQTPSTDRAPLVPILGVLGSLLLGLAVFAPAYRLPGGVEVSFHESGPPYRGNVLLGLAAGSFVLVWVFRWYRGLWVTSLGALAILAVAYLENGSPSDSARGVTVRWGWSLFGLGLLLLLAAAVLADVAKHQPEGEEPAAGG
jgi:hypothetical protein